MPLTYYHEGRLREFTPEPVAQQARLPVAPTTVLGARLHTEATSVHAAFARAPAIAREDRELIGRLRTAMRRGEALIWPTCSLITEGLRSADLAALRRRFGVRIAAQGRQGKVLLRLPGGEPRDLHRVFAAARACVEQHAARYAQPNFIKALPRHLGRSVGAAHQWNIRNDGTLGIRGADVDAIPAWQLTRGDPAIRIAVLDEGVDVTHPALHSAVVAQHDGAEGHVTAQPEARDTHGTACAGIIVSRAQRTQGLAPQSSLVAVRIARSAEPGGAWIFEDFKVAEAIDWTWQEGRADVLSNSWTDAMGADSITAALDRARQRGRQGRGSVVVCASGNNNEPVSYPATLPFVLTVGASNPWDQVKTPTSLDQETLWGSNFGPELDLVAPGVKIKTTVNQALPNLDAAGPYTANFHGTSAAAPHVAAAAGLVLALAPHLTETAVRQLLKRSAHRLAGASHAQQGAGRLDVLAALIAAPALKPRTSKGTKTARTRSRHRRSTP